MKPLLGSIEVDESMEITLEEQSFRNLVNFYRPELLAIKDGGPSTEILTINGRRRLRKHNVLVSEWRRGGPARVTPEALEVLSEAGSCECFHGSRMDLSKINNRICLACGRSVEGSLTPHKEVSS